MDIKQNILKKLIDTDEDFIYIISRHPIVYVPIMIVSSLGIIILFFLYKFLYKFSTIYSSYLCGILGLLLYFRFLLKFFDIYLDAIAITNSTLTIYKWSGLFKNTTDVIELSAIESVYADQSGLLDMLFNKGDIYIRRAGHTNVFNNVLNPNKVANNINSIAFSINNGNTKNNNNENLGQDLNDEKIKMLAQAMIEMLKEIK